MTDRTPESWWDSVDTDLPEPGVEKNCEHGIPGDAEPLPEGDAENDEDLS